MFHSSYVSVLLFLSSHNLYVIVKSDIQRRPLKTAEMKFMRRAAGHSLFELRLR